MSAVVGVSLGLVFFGAFLWGFWCFLLVGFLFVLGGLFCFLGGQGCFEVLFCLFWLCAFLLYVLFLWG